MHLGIQGKLDNMIDVVRCCTCDSRLTDKNQSAYEEPVESSEKLQVICHHFVMTALYFQFWWRCNVQ